MTIPAGWYPDPEGQAAWRWWDGTDWDTPTTAYPRLSSAQGPSIAKWLTLVVAWLSPALAVASAVASAAAAKQLSKLVSLQGQHLALHWSSGLTTMVLIGFASLLAELCVVLWLLQAGKLAKTLGYPMTLSVAWGAWSWILPILRWVLPLRLLLSLVPLGHPMRSRINLMWVIFIAFEAANLMLGLSASSPSRPAIFALGALGIAWALAFSQVISKLAADLEEASGHVASLTL